MEEVYTSFNELGNKVWDSEVAKLIPRLQVSQGSGVFLLSNFVTRRNDDSGISYIVHRKNDITERMAYDEITRTPFSLLLRYYKGFNAKHLLIDFLKRQETEHHVRSLCGEFDDSINIPRTQSIPFIDTCQLVRYIKMFGGVKDIPKECLPVIINYFSKNDACRICSNAPLSNVIINNDKIVLTRFDLGLETPDVIPFPVKLVTSTESSMCLWLKGNIGHALNSINTQLNLMTRFHPEWQVYSWCYHPIQMENHFHIHLYSNLAQDFRRVTIQETCPVKFTKVEKILIANFTKSIPTLRVVMSPFDLAVGAGALSTVMNLSRNGGVWIVQSIFSDLPLPISLAVGQLNELGLMLLMLWLGIVCFGFFPKRLQMSGRVTRSQMWNVLWREAVIFWHSKWAAFLYAHALDNRVCISGRTFDKLSEHATLSGVKPLSFAGLTVVYPEGILSKDWADLMESEELDYLI